MGRKKSKMGNPDYFKENRGPPLSASQILKGVGITKSQLKIMRDALAAVLPLCKHCGKLKNVHKAKTFNCPMGKKHRVVGFTYYSDTTVYEPIGLKSEE